MCPGGMAWDGKCFQGKKPRQWLLTLIKQGWEQRFAKCCPSLAQEEEEVSSRPAAGPSAFLLNNRAAGGVWVVECRLFPWHLSAPARLQHGRWGRAIIPIRELGN